MKEFSFIIDDELVKGLRADRRSPRNTFLLTECENIKPTEFGLVSIDEISQPISNAQLTLHSVTSAWPFPQLFQGQTYTLLLDETTLKIVDDDWELVDTSIYSAASPSELISVTAGGGVWHFSDMGDAWLFTNSKGQLLFPRYDLMQSDELPQGIILGVNNDQSVIPRLYYKADTVVSTTCVFRGRVLFHYGDNNISWGSIGGGDTWWYWFPSIASTSLDLALTRNKSNQAGWLKVPRQGTLQSLKPILGNKVGQGAVIAYCNNSVTALVPFGPDPASGFGVHTIPGLESIGIAQRGAVVGTDTFHVFLDSAGYLWRITADLKSERLGYSEFLEPLLADSDIQLSYDSERGDFFICSDEESYVLTRTGMCKASQRPTTLEHISGSTVGMSSGTFSRSFTVTTDSFDMGNRGLKTIQGVEINFKNITDFKCAIDWRNTSDETFTTSTFRVVDSRGVVTFPVSGVTFRMRLTGTTAANTEIGEIVVRWKQSDKRHLRGRY